MPDKPIGNPFEQVAQTGMIGSVLSTPQDQTSKRSGSQQLKRPAVRTSERQSVQESKRLNIQELERSSVQVSRSHGVPTSKHPDWVKQTSYLPPTLKRWLKLHAAATDREISEVIVEAVEEYRAKHERS